VPPTPAGCCGFPEQNIKNQTGHVMAIAGGMPAPNQIFLINKQKHFL
jgi:hypothetical protein